MDKGTLIQTLQGFDNEEPIFIDVGDKIYVVTGACEDQEGGIELLVKEAEQ